MRLGLTVLAAAAVLAWSPGELLPLILWELDMLVVHELCLLGEAPRPERGETVRQERRCEFYILH